MLRSARGSSIRSGGEVGAKVGLRSLAALSSRGVQIAVRRSPHFIAMAKHPPGPPMTLGNMRAYIQRDIRRTVTKGYDCCTSLIRCGR